MHVNWILVVMLIGIVRAELTSKDASEGPCNPDIVKYTATDYNPIASGGIVLDYYVPMGSQAMYRHYAEVFLGRSLANYTELAEMQLRIKFDFSTYAANRAFPKRENSPYFSQKCTPNAQNLPRPQVICKPICGSGSSSANLTVPGISQTLDSIIYTDNKTTLLIVRCPSDGIQDYKVLSTNKTISEPSKTIIIEKIEELGFSLNNLYYMQYE